MNPPKVRTDRPILNSERDYQEQIMLLGSYYKTRKLSQEIPVFITPKEQRYIDFAFIYPSAIHAFELKKREINFKDVSEKLKNKGYCEALRNTYPKRKITLTFISPRDFTVDARTLIEINNNEFNVDVKHETFSTFIFNLVKLMISDSPEHTKWHYIKELKFIFKRFEKNHLIETVNYLLLVLSEVRYNALFPLYDNLYFEIRNELLELIN